MRCALLIVSASAGCQLVFPHAGDPLPADAAIDAGPDGPSIQTCVGTFEDGFCTFAAVPPEIVVEATRVINTTNDVLCDPSIEPYCVVFAEQVIINAPLIAFGPRPLVLATTQEISISSTGVVNVASRVDRRGAGARDECELGEPPENNTLAAGGGAGGSFGGRGGNGGSAGVEAGGVAGTTESVPFALHGGCPGGRGAQLAAGLGGAAGEGGGAVLFASNDKLTIAPNGVVNASGAGGGGGMPRGAGGGGGSGGVIMFDAPAVSIDPEARVFANGVGGGEGGPLTGDPGRSGADPAAPDLPADGGQGAGMLEGGNGGDGAFRETAPRAGMGVIEPGHGGGGGGGVGAVVYININATDWPFVSPRPVTQ
jgi:hypothetical protein